MNYRRTKSWLKFVRRLKFHNRKYKDRLFQRVFQDKRDLLDLYNAINGTNHQNPEELEITTLEDVNSGHNAELMNKCKRLMHYSLFIARIRQNTNNGMSVEQAIDEAITYCIDHDILKDVLLKNRSEVRHMLLTEFDEKKFAKSMWEEGHESGYTEGHESGYTEGHESGYTEGHESGYTEGRESGYENILEIMDEINKGNDTVEKLVALGYDAKVVTEVLEKK